MSPGAFNALTYLWFGGSVFALLFALGSLVHAIAGWSGPYRNRRLLRFGIGLTVVPTLFAAYVAILWGIIIPADRRRVEQEAISADSLVHVGNSAPTFSLKDLDGKEFSLDDPHGKVVVVNFFATWCGPCVEEMPSLQKIWDEHGDQNDFAMLIIGNGETDEIIAAFRSKHGFTLPMASDVNERVYSQYAKDLIPRTYVASRDGKICFACGYLDDANLASLQQELAERLGSSDPRE